MIHEQLNRMKNLMGINESSVQEGWKDNVLAATIAASSLVGGGAKAQTSAHLNKPAITQSVAPKALAGNPAMDHNNFDIQVLAKYKEQNPGFWVKDANDIRKVQAEVKKFREFALRQIKSGKAEFPGQIPGDTTYSNFLPNALKTAEDGINGQYTSQFVFPAAYMNGKKIGVASDNSAQANFGSKLDYSQGLTVDQMMQWNKYVDWLKSTTVNDL